MALLHGVLAGSDSARVGMTLLYWITGCSVLFLVIVRGLTARPPRTRRARSDGSGAHSAGTRALSDVAGPSPAFAGTTAASTER